MTLAEEILRAVQAQEDHALIWSDLLKTSNNQTRQAQADTWTTLTQPY